MRDEPVSGDAINITEHAVGFEFQTTTGIRTRMDGVAVLRCITVRVLFLSINSLSKTVGLSQPRGRRQNQEGHRQALI